MRRRKCFALCRWRQGRRPVTLPPMRRSNFHHIDRQENDADREEKYPKDTAFFEQIAVACTDANCLVLIGRGHGHSNEAHHLTAYLAAHHPELSARVLPASVADLSHLTKSQLIELGYERLH